MTSPISQPQKQSIQSEEDIVKVRQNVKRIAALLNFRPLNQTKIMTAVSELARNTLEHGGGGEATISIIDKGRRRGLQIVFLDEGNGINDIQQALQDGFTTGNSMGLGLGGSKRLMDEFNIESVPGSGTKVTVVKWIS
ncbi:MAG: anti-sigma regulatory factor [Candidatus Obscuribacterales bacterium]|nr:anti-sigma regulatory factor [Candidatus Obscuribacterales bacterium]